MYFQIFRDKFPATGLFQIKTKRKEKKHSFIHSNIQYILAVFLNNEFQGEVKKTIIVNK